jgi:hypothetical protein
VYGFTSTWATLTYVGCVFVCVFEHTVTWVVHTCAHLSVRIWVREYLGSLHMWTVCMLLGTQVPGHAPNLRLRPGPTLICCSPWDQAKLIAQQAPPSTWCPGEIPEPYIYTLYDRIFGVFPAKNTVYTPYMYGSGQP